MSPAAPINVEQFEAERAHGLRQSVQMEMSQTSLAYLVFAVQCVLQNHPTSPTAAALLRDFIHEARRVGRFDGETERLIEQREEGKL